MTSPIRSLDDLRIVYVHEGWGLLALLNNSDPLRTESAARNAYRFAWDELVQVHYMYSSTQTIGKTCNNVFNKYTTKLMGKFMKKELHLPFNSEDPMDFIKFFFGEDFQLTPYQKRFIRKLKEQEESDG